MSKEKEPEKVFRIEYKCLNCNKEFEEEYCKGDEVKEDGIFGYIRLHSHKCEHTIGCKHCRYIECPVCGSKNIQIIERSPI